MSKGKLISGNIPEQVVIDILENTKQALLSLAPYEVPITREEKKYIPKSADAMKPFVEKGYEYSKTDTNYLPSYLNTTEIDNDFNRAKQSDSILREAMKIIAIVTNISICSKSDLYVAILDYYNNCCRAAKNGDARAKVIADEMGKLFKKSHKKKVQSTQP